MTKSSRLICAKWKEIFLSLVEVRTHSLYFTLIHILSIFWSQFNVLEWFELPRILKSITAWFVITYYFNGVEYIKIYHDLSFDFPSSNFRKYDNIKHEIRIWYSCRLQRVPNKIYQSTRTQLHKKCILLLEYG